MAPKKRLRKNNRSDQLSGADQRFGDVVPSRSRFTSGPANALACSGRTAPGRRLPSRSRGLTSPDSGDVEILGHRGATAPRARAARALAFNCRNTARRQADRERSARAVPIVLSPVAHRRGGARARRARGEAEGARGDASGGRSSGSGGMRAGEQARAALPGRADDRPRPALARQLWEIIRRFRARAHRTAHDALHEEAERLCDRVAIMDHGRIIALARPRADRVARSGYVVDFAPTEGGVPRIWWKSAANGGRHRRADGSDGVSLTVVELHRALPALLALLQQAAWSCRSSRPITHARRRLRRAHRTAAP